MIEEILYQLNHRQNVLLLALSGMGLNNITQKISKGLRIPNKSIVIDIYPHDSAFEKYSHLENLVLSKFRLEYLLDEPTSLDQLFNCLNKNSLKLTVILHKVQQYVNLPTYVDYVDSLYRRSSQVSILVTATFNQTIKVVQQHPLLIGCQKHIFPGFVGDFNKVIRELETAYGWQIKSEDKSRIYRLCLGHVGLIKSLMQLAAKNELPSTDKAILNHPIIKDRLVNLFESLRCVDVNLKNIFKSQRRQEEMGLRDKTNTGLLFEEYYKSYLDQESFLSQLTTTERSIFQYLLSRPLEYSTVDQIINFISPSGFDTKSNWSLYKHINNLNKKIQPIGYKLLSHRGAGYQIVLPLDNIGHEELHISEEGH